MCLESLRADFENVVSTICSIHIEETHFQLRLEGTFIAYWSTVFNQSL
jgi:hypothetical protein